MIFEPTPLAGSWLILPEAREDERGFLLRTYCETEFLQRELNTRWPQCNLTLTRKRGMLRGLHFQIDPNPEIKLVRCASGTIWDVIVDIRPASPTHGRWAAFELSGENRHQVYVPAGFAHGFQCLTDDCEVFYQMSEFYDPQLARGIRWNDPHIGVEWPLEDVILSERDRNLPLFSAMDASGM